MRRAARRCAGAAGCAAALSPSRLVHGEPRGAPVAVGPPTPYVSPPRPPRGGGAVRGARGRRRAGAGDEGPHPSRRPGARSRPGQDTPRLRAAEGGGRLWGYAERARGSRWRSSSPQLSAPRNIRSPDPSVSLLNYPPRRRSALQRAARAPRLTAGQLSPGPRRRRTGRQSRAGGGTPGPSQPPPRVSPAQ